MAKRITSVVVLAEDRVQYNLIRRFVIRVTDNDRGIRPAKGFSTKKCAEQFVRKNYALEVKECRRQTKLKNTLLVVVIDADKLSVEERAGQLAKELESAEVVPRIENEPIAVLIPKRNVETWIYCLLGETVDELTDYSRRAGAASHTKEAAVKVFDWSRLAAKVPDSCVPSLRDSFPEWRRIG